MRAGVPMTCCAEASCTAFPELIGWNAGTPLNPRLRAAIKGGEVWRPSSNSCATRPRASPPCLGRAATTAMEAPLCRTLISVR
jgi:hypothetical protein